MVYIITVERIIKVTSDAINLERARLMSLARKLEKSACRDYSISTNIFSDLLIAPNLPNSILGYFHEKYRIIVLSEDLLEFDESSRDNILKHELSHALEYALDGATGHGNRFKAFTAYFGTDKDFEKAKVEKAALDKNKVKTKVEKLLALSSSPFENEALQALLKAQKMMIENHIETQNKEEKLFFVELYESGRTPHYISSILDFISFATGVFIVRSTKSGKSVSTCYGSLDEVEFSIYLFDYILSESDNEVKKSKKKGINITKNSFIMGAMPEMKKKLKTLSENTENALAIIRDENRILSKKLVFTNTRLRTQKHSASIQDYNSFKIGKNFGESLPLPQKIDRKKLNG